jgi:hypothetical protein
MKGLWYKTLITSCVVPWILFDNLLVTCNSRIRILNPVSKTDSLARANIFFGIFSTCSTCVPVTAALYKIEGLRFGQDPVFPIPGDWASLLSSCHSALLLCWDEWMNLDQSITCLWVCLNEFLENEQIKYQLKDPMDGGCTRSILHTQSFELNTNCKGCRPLASLLNLDCFRGPLMLLLCGAIGGGWTTNGYRGGGGSRLYILVHS